MSIATMTETASKAGVKGSALKSTLTVIREMLGESDYARVLAGLGEEDRRLLEGPVLATSFYPFELSNKITIAAAAIARQPEPAFARMVGKRACQMALGGVYKWVIAGVGALGGNSGIKYIINKGSGFFSQLYDRGRLRVEPAGENQALVVLEEFPSVPVTCSRIAGWLEGMVEAGGGKNVRVVHPRCKGEGAARCEWLGRWD